MGAEESIIKSYDVDPPYDKHADSTIEGGQDQPKLSSYVIHHARHRGNGSNVSIFVYNKRIEPKIGPACAEVQHDFSESLFRSTQCDCQPFWKLFCWYTYSL